MTTSLFYLVFLGMNNINRQNLSIQQSYSLKNYPKMADNIAIR